MDSLVLDYQPYAHVVFGAFLVLAQVADIYFNILPDVVKLSNQVFCFFSQIPQSFMKFLEAVAKVYRDFSKGHFYIPRSKTNNVVLESAEHIRELSDTPQLSQRAVYADIFGFKQSMKHGATPLDPTENTPARYKLFSSAIKMVGIPQLTTLQPYLQGRLEKTVQEHVESRPASADGWRDVQLAPFMRGLATGMLGTYFFGDELFDEPDFHHATLDFYHDVFRCMGTLQIVPAVFKDAVYGIMTKNGKALRIMFERMRRALAGGKEGWNEDGQLRQVTLLHIMHELSLDKSYWDTDKLIQAITGIWFAASHQPWINLHFIFLELCTRPEYVEMLRAELSAQPHLDAATLTSLPLLDSFMKESVRLNPLDMMAIRRKALKPYTFPRGGPHVAEGSTVCVNAFDIMHNEARYPNPFEFDGLRFVKQHEKDERPMRGTTFVDASKDFPVWGFGTRVCPGRWHADLVLKMAISHLVMKYDFRLARPNARFKWWWDTFQLPFESTRVLFRKR